MNKTPAPDSSDLSELSRPPMRFLFNAHFGVAPPYITENGVISPLVPVAIIDRESDEGSYADALDHSVNIKQEDYNGTPPRNTEGQFVSRARIEFRDKARQMRRELGLRDHPALRGDV